MPVYHPIKVRSMHRRHFLKLAGTCCASLSAASLTSCTHKKFYNPDQDIIIGGGRFRQSGDIHNVLAIANLYQGDTRLVETTFLPHSCMVDPRDKKRLICIEYKGSQAAAISLEQHENIEHYTPGSPRIFSGYGCFDNTGDTIYTIETDTMDNAGSIVIRDKDFKYLAEANSHGKNPTHCQLIGDRKVIMVANSGDTNSSANIAYIDLQDNKLLDKIAIKTGVAANMYFSTTTGGNKVVTNSEPLLDRLAQVSISDKKLSFEIMQGPEALTEKLYGSAYNICIDERNDIAAISHPEANLLTFWSISSRKLHKAMSVPNPKGITLTLDNKHYIVSYGIDSSIIRIRTDDLIADRTSVMQPTYITGQHIINWSATLRQIMPTKVYD